MNPVVDTIVVVLFVLLMIYIIRGYHHSKYNERFDETDASQRDSAKESSSGEPSEK